MENRVLQFVVCVGTLACEEDHQALLCHLMAVDKKDLV